MGPRGILCSLKWSGVRKGLRVNSWNQFAVLMRIYDKRSVSFFFFFKSWNQISMFFKVQTCLWVAMEKAEKQEQMIGHTCKAFFTEDPLKPINSWFAELTTLRTASGFLH